MVKKGQFRSDLYYRLFNLPIVIPPLRDRKGDIPLLAQHFLKKFKRRTGNEVLTFDELALEKLSQHEWPGNVRELGKEINRAAIVGNGRIILPQDILAQMHPAEKQDEQLVIKYGDLASMINQFKRNVICYSLKINDGNRSCAAKDIKKQRTYLSRMIHHTYNITEEEWEEFPVESFTKGFVFDPIEKFNEIITLQAEVDRLKRQAAKLHEDLAGSNKKNRPALEDTTLNESQKQPAKKQPESILNLITRVVITDNNGLTEKAWSNHGKEFIKHGIKTKNALLYQIRKQGLRDGCEKAKSKYHTALIIKLVIKKNNGLVAKTWNNHSKEFIESEIKTRGDLNYRIRSNELSERCKKTRFSYYRKAITKKLMKKHNNNFIKIAKELIAPRTEVCAFGKNLMNAK